MKTNRDEVVIKGFGDEWTRFDNLSVSDEELETLFHQYFAVFPWDDLPTNAVGADFGCGSGRWARYVAPRVGHLYCVDPSGAALSVARAALKDEENVTFIEDDVETRGIKESTLDFGYSLGVMHHIPDTKRALGAAAERLKPGAPFLVYLYYRFDDRPRWYRVTWRLANVMRLFISRLPNTGKYFASQVIAFTVYLPLARGLRLVERFGVDVSAFPLSEYRKRSLYVMRTDALDRFGTRLEQRFTRSEIEAMMMASGLERIRFSESAPFWCAVGYRETGGGGGS